MDRRLTKKEEKQIITALSHGSLRKIAKYLDEGWNPRFPLRGANALLYVEHVDVAQRLIAAGADPNESFNSQAPLLFRSGSGHMHMVRFLIKAGADVDVRYERNDDPQTAYGTTAIINALRHGKTDMAKLLMKAGADINLRDEHGHNALWHALYIRECYQWSRVTSLVAGFETLHFSAVLTFPEFPLPSLPAEKWGRLKGHVYALCNSEVDMAGCAAKFLRHGTTGKLVAGPLATLHNE